MALDQQPDWATDGETFGSIDHSELRLGDMTVAEYSAAKQVDEAKLIEVLVDVIDVYGSTDAVYLEPKAPQAAAAAGRA